MLRDALSFKLRTYGIFKIPQGVGPPVSDEGPSERESVGGGVDTAIGA